ncbi:MAG: hypothetical protein PHW78_01540, partial [Macromonas bipunctata]|nr:hypothetical protein [Macromonas bipunctata]
MKKQAGGTFLGVTIGLLVGLAAALLVAMYVTKTPIPLVDRGVQGKPDQDALEQERNKSWNPNAGWSSPTLPSAVGGLDSAPPPPTLPAPVDTSASNMNGGVGNAVFKQAMVDSLSGEHEASVQGCLELLRGFQSGNLRTEATALLIQQLPG